MQKIKVMKLLFSSTPVKVLAIIVLSIATFSFKAKMGLDSFEIYLNNKLVLKQSVNQPLDLRILQLDKANDDDQLRITYKHCSGRGVGTDRSISVKDEKGTVLKKWVFANTAGSDMSMVIPVKEIFQLRKNNTQHDLSLHYSAKELSKSETLAFLHSK